jgi:hypothetical protein
MAALERHLNELQQIVLMAKRFNVSGARSKGGTYVLRFLIKGDGNPPAQYRTCWAIDFSV